MFVYVLQIFLLKTDSFVYPTYTYTYSGNGNGGSGSGGSGGSGGRVEYLGVRNKGIRE